MLRLLLVVCLFLVAACNRDTEEPQATRSPAVSRSPLQLGGEADFQLEGIVARASLDTETNGAQTETRAWGLLHVMAGAVPQPPPGCPSVQNKIVPVYVATDTVIQPLDVLYERPLTRTLPARAVKVAGKAGSHEGKNCVMSAKTLEFQPRPVADGGRSGEAPPGGAGATSPGAPPPGGQAPGAPAPGAPAPDAGTTAGQAPGAPGSPSPFSPPPGGTSTITRRPGTSRVNPLDPPP